ncbi:hypothetical protein K5D48_09790 [Pseudomonas cichorii]|nr:hypothetical protein [Pseudomonas cichorii]
MNYTVYPAQEAEKPLTARVAIVQLGDHLQAFLNSNNISSWAPTDDYILREDRLADVLVCLGTAKGMSIAQIKYRAKKLLKLVRAYGNPMKLSFAYDLVANCLGYKAFRLAHMCRSIDHYVENLWPLEVINNGRLFNEGAFLAWPSSSTSEMLRERMQFNKQRDSLYNDIKKRSKIERTKKESEYLQTRNRALARRANQPIETRD